MQEGYLFLRKGVFTLKPAVPALTMLLLTIVASSVLLGNVSLVGVGAQSEQYDFSIVQITDTQYLSFDPVRFNALTQWIVDNAQAYNVKMVIHTGDIVEDGEDTDQWSVANSAFMRLLNNNVPYCWAIGNHDQIPFDDFDGTALACQYPAFDTSHLKQKSYWVSDIFDAKNTAVQFSFGNYQFLLIGVENGGNSSVIAWMKNLIEKNPNANIVVGTHDYIDDNGPTTSWGYAFRETLRQYPNVFMAVCGHNFGTVTNSYHVQDGTRTDIFWNRQEADNGQGAHSVRIYRFSLQNNRVDASTYQLWNDSWLTGDNEFSFSFEFLQQQTAKPLNVAVNTDRTHYTKWSHVNLLVSVTDGSTNTPLAGTLVDVTVLDTHNRIVWSTSGVTDQAGQLKATYKLVFDAQMGTYTINARATCNGYETRTSQRSFFSIG